MPSSPENRPLGNATPHANVAARTVTIAARRQRRCSTRPVEQGARETGMYLSGRICELDQFELVSDGSALPVFAFKLKDEVDKYTVFDISELLRVKGWLVPAYTMPPDLEHIAVLRVVVRNGFSHDMAHMLMTDLQWATKRLGAGVVSVESDKSRSDFNH